MPDLSKIENEVNDRYEMFRDSFPEQANMNIDNFINTALRHIAHTPSLQDCSIKSILHELRFAAQLGLYVGDEYRQAFLDDRYIPEGEQTVAKLIPGFQGHIKLAQRDGNVQTVRPRAVYENDEFQRTHGTRENEEVHHRPMDEGNRGELWKAYAVFTFQNTDDEVATIIDRERVERIKEALGGTAASAWEDEVWEEDMWKKTAIIYGCKYVITDNEASRALNRFAGSEFGDDFEGVVDQRDTPERAEEALGLTDTPEGEDEPFTKDDEGGEDDEAVSNDTEKAPDSTGGVDEPDASDQDDAETPDDPLDIPGVEQGADDVESDEPEPAEDEPVDEADEDVSLDDIEGLDQGVDDLSEGPDRKPSQPDPDPTPNEEAPPVETIIERLAGLLTEELIEDSTYSGDPANVAESVVEATLDKRFDASADKAPERARIGMGSYLQAVRTGQMQLAFDDETLPVYDREDEQ